jgi:hypothetical protein
MQSETKLDGSLKTLVQTKMFNIFVKNYPGFTKYGIENDGGVNHASKKDIVRGRHSICLSYLTGWQEQLQRSDISALLQISW